MPKPNIHVHEVVYNVERPQPIHSVIYKNDDSEFVIAWQENSKEVKISISCYDGQAAISIPSDKMVEIITPFLLNIKELNGLRS